MLFRFVVLAACLAASPALAASRSDPAPDLEVFVGSAGYQDNINRVMSQLPPSVFQRCPGLVSDGSKVTVIEPVAFSDKGVPVSGSWKHSFPVKGCGNDTTINLYFRGEPGGKVASIVGIPGDTRANLILQRDALGFATMSARAQAPGCKEIDVRDSKPVGPMAREDVAWTEDWTVSACGRLLRVPMTFTPDATGATISAARAVPLR